MTGASEANHQIPAFAGMTLVGAGMTQGRGDDGHGCRSDGMGAGTTGGRGDDGRVQERREGEGMTGWVQE